MRHTVRGITMILGLAVLAGCDHELPTTPEEPVAPAASSLVDLPAELCGVPTEVALLADETVPAGMVTASNDDSYLYVTYATAEAWPIHETALYVADDLSELPTAGRHGNPVVGRFPMSAPHPAGTFEVTWRADLAELSGDEATIAAYAEVGPKAELEGAWGDGDRISDSRGKGSWATFFTHAVQECETQPTAVISAPAEGASVQAGTPLAFDGSGSEDPAGGGLTYAWDFGDGTLGGVATLAHPYSIEGGYTATLTVTDVNGESDQAAVQVNVTPPPAPTNTDGVLRGEVTDQVGQPLANVAIEMVGGGVLGTSDADGNVLIENFPTGVVRVLRLSLSGYTSDIVRVEVDPVLGEGFFTGALRPRNNPSVLPDAAAGGTVTGEDGAEITLPPNVLVDGAGNPVTGPVEVAITPIDVTGPEIQAFPGGFEGVGSDGATGAILSLGATEYTLTQEGDELQLAPGATAMLRLPIYTTGAAEGDAVAQWTLDEATGLWIQEGAGTVVSGAAGLALEAEVGHLSWKNVDVFSNTTIAVMSCEDFLGLLFDACYLSVETTGDGPAWADATAIAPEGAELPLPVGVTLEFDGLVFADQCVARGAVTVEIPESGEVDPIVIEVDCLDGDPTDPAVRLEYGDRLAAEIAEAEEVDRYVWAGEAGDEVRIDLDPGTLDGLYEVRAPDGTGLESGNFDSGSLDVFLTLAATGDHEITVLGFDSSETGSYTVGIEKFVDAGPQAVTLPATIPASIGFPELETDVYTFEGAAGDEVSFAVKTENRLADGLFRFQGDVRVFSPSDALVAHEYFGQTSREIAARGLRLAETGTYRVEIRSRTLLDDPDEPGAYVLELLENPATALSDGDVIPEGIAADLEVDVFSFEFPASETVRVTLTGPDVTQADQQLRIRIHDPSGGELVYSGARGENHFFVDTPASGGEHRITIHGENASATPDYELAFAVFEPQPVQTLVDGDVLTDEIGFPPEIDTYEFEGQDGDEMTLTVGAAQADAFEGAVQILDPVGTPIASGSFTESAAFGEVQVLGATGTYTVEVSGTDGIPFLYEIALALAAPPDPNLLSPGDIVDGSIDFTSGTDEYTLDGTSGQIVRIHAITGTSSSFDGFVRLIAPSNTALVDERFNDTGSANSVVTLTETGTHTIVIGQAFSTGTGAYRLGVGGGVGRPDLGFANSGVFKGAFGDGSFERVVPRASGGILALSSDQLFAFTSTGALDGGFGSGGEVDLFALTGTGVNTAVAELSDGSIVVASPVRTSTFNGWRVAKLDGSGAADPAFGSGGVVDIPLTQSIDQLQDQPEAVLEIPDGTGSDVLVVGDYLPTATGNARVVTMARLNPDGSFDASFGGGANPLVTAQTVSVAGAEMQSDGRIVVGGSFGSGNVLAYRYDPDGSQDLAFGSSGEANIDFGSGSVDGMAMRPDDRFVVFGGSFDAVAVQFTASGFADGAFGSGGIVQIDYEHLERALAGAVDGSTGHLYLAGQLEIRDSGEDEGMLIRLLSDGSLDTSFGAGAFVFADEPDQIQGVAVDGSGRILLGGREFGSSSTPMLLRLLP